MKSTHHNSIPDFSKLVNIPYDQADCWKLSKRFYSEILKIELNHYFDKLPSDRIQMKNLIYTNIGDFERTDNPKFGDLILLRIKGIESHIAINIDNSRMFHTMRNTGSVIDRKSRWSTLITGYYTLKVNYDKT